MRERRAVSTTLSYTLTLAISALLVTGLIVAGGNYVDDRREQIIRDELAVVGQQVAADAGRADRLVRAANTTGAVNLSLNQTFPDRITGANYRVSLDPDGPAVVLGSVDPEVSVSVRFKNQTDIGASTVGGGPVQIWYNESGQQLEVRDV